MLNLCRLCDTNYAEEINSYLRNNRIILYIIHKKLYIYINKTERLICEHVYIYFCLKNLIEFFFFFKIRIYA